MLHFQTQGGDSGQSLTTATIVPFVELECVDETLQGAGITLASEIVVRAGFACCLV